MPFNHNLRGLTRGNRSQVRVLPKEVKKNGWITVGRARRGSCSRFEKSWADRKRKAIQPKANENRTNSNGSCGSQRWEIRVRERLMLSGVSSCFVVHPKRFFKEDRAVVIKIRGGKVVAFGEG
jgi:hypothetical protein